MSLFDIFKSSAPKTAETAAEAAAREARSADIADSLRRGGIPSIDPRTARRSARAAHCPGPRR